MSRPGEYYTIFCIGGISYGLLELLWRGRTHWTMIVLGGVCLMFIYHTEEKYADAPRVKRCIADTLMISASELSVGFVVNILLKLHVWDYSNQPFNLFGQICALYSGLWFLLCLPVTRLCSRLRTIIKSLPYDGKRVKKEGLSV